MSPSDNANLSDRRTRSQISDDVKERIQGALESAYKLAKTRLNSESEWNLSPRFRKALDDMSSNSAASSTGFTNLITCLAIKVSFPEHDIRYHQVQIGAPFAFRPASEKVVYPWLDEHEFNGAKSGWQTRTFERPKPYKLNYDENIDKKIKEPFLICFDEIQERGASAFEGLSYLFQHQIKLRSQKEAILRDIRTDIDDDISLIVEFFREHFDSKYSSRGASRLPVLALYATLSLLTKEVGRYTDSTIRPLERPSAADERTGAIGDIEIARQDGSIFEAFEIKHQIQIDRTIVRTAEQKVEGTNLDRYYILTTHINCKPDQEILDQLRKVRTKTGCQIIVNGIIPTIQYYLRLLSQPNEVVPLYTELLGVEQAIDNEHRRVWANLLGSSAAKEVSRSQVDKRSED